jgi:hypothetical protein
VSPGSVLGDVGATPQGPPALLTMVQLVTQAVLEQIDGLGERVSGHLGPHQVAADVDQDLGFGGTGPGRIGSNGEFDPAEEDRLVDAVDHRLQAVEGVGDVAVANITVGHDSNADRQIGRHMLLRRLHGRGRAGFLTGLSGHVENLLVLCHDYREAPSCARVIGHCTTGINHHEQVFAQTWEIDRCETS